MSDYTDSIGEGIFCDQCGVFFGDLTPPDNTDEIRNPPGHLRTCADCKAEARRRHRNRGSKNRHKRGKK